MTQRMFFQTILSFPRRSVVAFIYVNIQRVFIDCMSFIRMRKAYICSVDMALLLAFTEGNLGEILSFSGVHLNAISYNWCRILQIYSHQQLFFYDGLFARSCFAPWTLKQWRHTEAAYTIIIIMYLWVCFAILYLSSKRKSPDPPNQHHHWKKNMLILVVFFRQTFLRFLFPCVMYNDGNNNISFWAISAVLRQHKLNTQAQYL